LGCSNAEIDDDWVDGCVVVGSVDAFVTIDNIVATASDKGVAAISTVERVIPKASLDRLPATVPYNTSLSDVPA